MLAYGELCEALKDEEEAMKAYDNALIENPGMGKAHLRKVTDRADRAVCGTVMAFGIVLRPLGTDFFFRGM